MGLFVISGAKVLIRKRKQKRTAGVKGKQKNGNSVENNEKLRRGRLWRRKSANFSF